MIDTILNIPDRLSKREAARKCGVALSTLRSWERYGVRGHRLEAYRLGGRVYFSERQLVEFLNAVNRTAQQKLAPAGKGGR